MAAAEGSCWEERMAWRAAQRRPHERAVQDRSIAVRLAERDALEARHLAPMTLKEATGIGRWESFACACAGSPGCCRYVWAHARAMTRAAHIVVKLIADGLRR